MSVHPALMYAARDFPQHAASALVSSVWEGVALVAATGLFLHLLPQTTARFRFWVWSAVFLILTALPMVNISLVSHSAGSSVGAIAPLQLDPRWSYGITVLWIAVALVRAAHLAVHAAKLHALWASAVPATGVAAAELAPVLGKVELCTSTRIDRPSVIGFFAPRILIPAWLFDQLTPAELHQIVLHELEHLRRRDDWLNLLQKLGLVVFPLNPALHWIDRRLATERELACDDGVLDQTRAPRAYATVLTSLAERRLAYRRGGRISALALGAIGALRRSEFSRRIESILSQRPTLAPAPFRATLAMAVAGMLTFGAATTRAPQLVSFSAANTPQQTALPASIHSAGEAYMEQPAVKPAAQFLNASFRVPAKADSPHSAKKAKRTGARVVKASLESRKDSGSKTANTVEPLSVAAQPERHWMVLTSWHETAPTSVLITLPDGSTILTTYSAMPTQVDWLLVQL